MAKRAVPTAAVLGSLLLLLAACDTGVVQACIKGLRRKLVETADTLRYIFNDLESATGWGRPKVRMG